MSGILTLLPRPFFVLAPMDDVTDSVFRRVVAGCARPNLFFTEFVNVDGLQSPGRPKLAKKIKVASDEERPIFAQLWGKNPENFRKSAGELVEMGFAGIDLNMGCPAKTEVSNGTCSALIKNRPLAHDIIEATKAGVAGRVPVSVKTRLGFNEIDLTWHEFLLEHQLDMLTVHGRTRKEMSKVPAHWDEIGKVRQLRDSMLIDGRLKLNTLIIGNGDVENRQHASLLCSQFGLDGAMIGRGLFHDPYAFAVSSPWPSVSRDQRLELFARHIRLFAETWQVSSEEGEARYERPIVTLNKFCKIYVNGFDGAKELREQLMSAGSTDELLRILQAAKSTG
jgi:tRNA-dihydrouridine synthase